jgi:peptide chain release factor 3
MNWPLGNGETFRGVYDRGSGALHLFERTEHGAKRAPVTTTSPNDPAIAALVDERTYREFLDQLELLEGAGAAFDREAMLRGDVSPVFFGSAVTNFGVELFLDAFVAMGPPPAPRRDVEERLVEPTDERFTGFVFKIQANMDPRHRDRVAFLRVCSGKFERDMTVRNVRTGKDVRLTRAMKLFASERESVDVAYAGDVVGLANPGVFAIGDTLAEGDHVRFEPIPAFDPEHFALVRSIDTAAYKSFQKGIAQLREEGAIQVFYPYGAPRTEPILAAVGALQFEVVKYRLESEYNVKTVFQTLPYTLARRVRPIAADGVQGIANATLPSNARLVEDWEEHALALFESAWSVDLAKQWNPGLAFDPFGAEAGREALA